MVVAKHWKCAHEAQRWVVTDVVMKRGHGRGEEMNKAATSNGGGLKDED